ncbi:dihydroorotase [Lutibacter oricola]|uniref:Dihydroorotase n=1 Tax=Lutibacter oricola TaxID=762486 RepID=A0A1H2W7P9_9FLAO|nr:dihydroorotase [Lutibacter oricola]SDW76568.1 dihydroorotase [Lutibacter oricola]
MMTLLKSAKIIDQSSPFHNKTVDILIENGIIKEISPSISSSENYKEYNFENLHVSQGWFDSSVCFGEPGFEERETISNGLKTAAKSGFTAVAVNPKTNPVVDNKSAVEYILNKACGSATKIYPIGSLTKNSEGKDIAELFDMQNSGAVAFGDYNKALNNANLLKICLQYAQNFNALVLSYPQDNSIAGLGIVNEEVNSTKLGLKGIPTLAEEMQIARDLFLLEYTGGKLHIPTISTAKSVKLIKEAKQKGLDVTCSVTAHHLTLTDDELKSFDTNTKVLPPLRTSKDIKALIKGVENGTIDMITSDHNPIDIEHKKVEYSNAKNGTIGLESLFGATNTVLATETIVNALTTNAKNRFNIKQTPVNIGEQADLTLFNPEGENLFLKENIFSTSKNAIYLNKPTKGTVYGVIANNKIEL